MTRRSPAEYRWDDILFDETLLTKHFNRGRAGAKIEYITVHHMILRSGDPNKTEALDACYRIWQTRKASAHYGVEDKFVRQYVNDWDTAWANGQRYSNRRSIAVEHANTQISGNYPVSETTWKTVAKLVAYLCYHYKLGRPQWGKNVRKHNEFSATACPGPFMESILPNAYIKEAQRVYDSISRTDTVKAGDTLYAIAKRYGTTVSSLQAKNGMGSSTLLSIGKVLKV